MVLSRTVILWLVLFLRCSCPDGISAGENESAAKLTPAEAKAIAQEAFLWGMHPIAIYHLRYNLAQNDKSPCLCRHQPPELGSQTAKGIAADRHHPQRHHALWLRPARFVEGACRHHRSRDQGPLLEHPALRQLCASVAPDRQPVQYPRPGAAVAHRPELERQAARRLCRGRHRAINVQLRRCGGACCPHR